MTQQDSARIGKAVESLVGATVVLSSGGELNVSTSLVDDEGVDLVFNRRGAPSTLAVQVKTRTTESKRVAGGGFWAHVTPATFAPRPSLAMLFAVVDVPSATLEPVWLVPSEDFAERAYRNPSDDTLWIRTKTDADDQWAPYRLGLNQVADRVLGLLGVTESRVSATGEGSAT